MIKFERQKPWDLPGWEIVSYERKMDFSLDDVEDYQDILSTFDCTEGAAAALVEERRLENKERRREQTLRRKPHSF